MKELQTTADTLLGKSVSDGDVPGVAAMAAGPEGIIYEGAFGARTLNGPPMTTDTVCWIASMSKAVTGVCAAQLIEQGKFDLDAPASRIVPAIGEAQVLTGFAAHGQPITRAPKRDVTLRHLLTHTAGFSYEIWNTDIQKVQAAWGLPGIIEGKNAGLRTPLLFDPGEGWEYGLGIDWVGKMIEAVSGMDLGAYMQQRVFEPLGMDSTDFRISPTMRERLASVHQRGEDGKLVATPFEIPQDPEYVSGGHGLHSTAADYMKLLRMILNGGEFNGIRVLQPETVRMMAMDHANGNRVKPMPSAIPPLTNPSEFFPGSPKTFGLTFQINLQDEATGRKAGTLMWGGLSNCYFWIDPHSNLCGVFITQILPYCDVKALPLFYEFERAVYSSAR
ncbi:MAG: beta-lactamase family protein [Flavobacteriales bacterium]|nr:beta-lactamase family protein [Flavobacteriales bacterium]